ncbi:TrpB-like pyridoxal phosphate-dependent enzyme [Sulfolobus acidocaldarius]|uniref:Tryptophan synthase beta chain n=4 Tax=Sulfolobus acidocaldarius TaxID=2285 RepID=Q4J8Y0_SULAC|nr:TrpB-like pyridoxal phosphate-dependent enzyme [Sulfolobus acidocaldarius]AAY80751.1 tryptophan synthase beta chain 1 [Sulfolobus acidocaldarius DSM 639]AGE71347.1 tryptophan synthase subunit beta [Sulfolobus acidocaldarius N8]AGE73618.1 tryptophan synthase subunit beta [Sulfolobus acidocaldarius Ron12/I]ALU30401.1 tryptophan synthase beta chain [Sulfolobus acidocaldarius]ALU31122.1 tryptophan synthase beta chain [Sulfolobus acidocaldarius]
MVNSFDIIPKYWYNIIPDLPKPLPPPRDPQDAEFSRIDLLRKILPKEVLRQEFTIERFVKIPDEVRDRYINIGRPTPLIRARRLEEYLKTPARIYFKYEGATPTGSHKINTAIPQAYFAANEGVSHVTTETGAGQWGTAVALAASMYDLESTIFMVRVSYEHKPMRRTIMELYGAKVHASPTDLTEFGRKILKEDSRHPGSLGIAMSEAIEYALENNYRYLVGSVLDVVILHQSIIGMESINQLEALGEEPDTIIGCVGGGSNFGGFTYPFIGTKRGKKYIAVGSSEVPKFSKGKYEYDFPDSAGLLPLVKMITLGKDFIPPPIYSGGLRYHGVAPTLSLLVKEKVVEWREYTEEEIYNSAKIFMKTQGIIPAPESAHAIKAAIDEALEAKKTNDKKVILVNVSGHGLLDLSNYESMKNRVMKK